MIDRRDFMAAAGAALAATRAHAQDGPTSLPSLGDAYREHFRIGAALDFRTPDEFSETELELIRTQFNVLTPENSMKPGPVHPEEDSWNWTPPDTLVDFCQANGMATMGHCLVWHSQTNPWFFEGADRSLTLERLRNHIHTLVGRFRGRIAGWDVVNEAIDDAGETEGENLRATRWLELIGPDYLRLAFEFAREADPDAALHYNDYSIESGAKHRSSLRLLERLLSEGAPITTVGIQGHWSVTGLDSERLREIEEAIVNYQALGLRVAITELDVTTAGGGGGQLGRGRRGGGAPPSPEMLAAQADAYARLFSIFLEHRDAIDRVTFWGLHDQRSWRRGLNPLVFDGDSRPKPAFRAIIDAAARVRA